MTSKKNASVENPVIAEVRTVRRALWREGGETAAGYMALMRRLARERELEMARRGPKRKTSRGK